MAIDITTMSGRVLYTAEHAQDVRAAVQEALSNHADLGGADLRDAYLGDAYLRDADLRGANLGGAYLRGANLRSAYLRNADLGSVYLRDADLRDADLRSANLDGADLRGAYLGSAYLRDADLRDADLRSANLDGAYLGSADLRSAQFLDDYPAGGITFDAGPLGAGWLIPTKYGWRVSIGHCWRNRPLTDLQDLIDDRAEWPETAGEERDRRRLYLRAVLALCEAHIGYSDSTCGRSLSPARLGGERP